MDLPDLTDLQTAAVGMHEMFTSLMEAGFTENQAIKMTVELATSSIREEGD